MAEWSVAETLMIQHIRSLQRQAISIEGQGGQLPRGRQLYAPTTLLGWSSTPVVSSSRWRQSGCYRTNAQRRAMLGSDVNRLRRVVIYPKFVMHDWTDLHGAFRLDMSIAAM
jgi:hypothetical protein